jgi:glycosyltransferase involved in cell wall biosynthesis
MRILEFNDAFWPNVGGIERFLLQITEHLHEQGHEVVVAAHHTQHDGTNPFPFSVHWRPSEEKLGELVDWCDLLHLNTMHVGLLLRAVLRRKRIVTTNHDVTMICPKGNKIRYDGPCRNRAGPVVCMKCLKRSHTPKPWQKLVRPPAKGLLSLLTQASVVTSPWALRRYKLFHKVLIPLGTDVEHFRPAEARRPGDEADRLPRVIMVGRVVYEKGAHVAVEALRHCRDAGHPFELVICSDGPHMPEVKAAVAARDVGSLVTFRGFISEQELIAALQSADVAVMPSLWEESFGYTAIEAMACGLPVIASNTGALGSIVGELGPEMIFERGDAVQLAGRLQWLLADRARRRAKGEAARRLALEKYDLRRMLHAYDDLFASLIWDSGNDADPARRTDDLHRLRKAR